MSRPQVIRDRSVDMNTNFCGISEENKCNHRREGNRPDTPKRSISGNRDEGRMEVQIQSRFGMGSSHRSIPTWTPDTTDEIAALTPRLR